MSRNAIVFSKKTQKKSKKSEIYPNLPAKTRKKPNETRKISKKLKNPLRFSKFL